MESGLTNMTAEGEVPVLDPQMLKHKAIVKVFVIDHNEGFWLDCGAGDAQFVVDSKLSSLDAMAADDVCISVLNTYEEPQSRDFIDPVRERKLRNNKDDKNTLLEVNFGQAIDFNKCQSSRHFTSHHHQLGAEGHKREHSAEFPGSVGLQGLLESDLRGD